MPARYIDSLKTRAKGYPVVAHADTLFYVYTKLGPFSPRERAALTAEKVQTLEKGVFFSPDSLRIYPSEQTVDMMYGEQVLQSISDNDALWQNVTHGLAGPSAPARYHAGRARYKEANSWQNILKEVGLMLLTLLVLFFSVKYINVFFRWVRVKISREGRHLVQGREAGHLRVFHRQRQLGAVLLLLTVLRWVVILLIIYLVLPMRVQHFSRHPGHCRYAAGLRAEPAAQHCAVAVELPAQPVHHRGHCGGVSLRAQGDVLR